MKIRLLNLHIELENELRANINENSEYIKDISNEILETKKSFIYSEFSLIFAPSSFLQTDF